MHVHFKVKSTSPPPQTQEKTSNLSPSLSSGPAVCCNSNAELPSQRLVRALSAVRAHVDLEGILVRRLFNVNHP